MLIDQHEKREGKLVNGDDSITFAKCKQGKQPRWKGNTKDFLVVGR